MEERHNIQTGGVRESSSEEMVLELAQRPHEFNQGK